MEEKKKGQIIGLPRRRAAHYHFSPLLPRLRPDFPVFSSLQGAKFVLARAEISLGRYDMEYISCEGAWPRPDDGEIGIVRIPCGVSASERGRGSLSLCLLLSGRGALRRGKRVGPWRVVSRVCSSFSLSLSPSVGRPSPILSYVSIGGAGGTRRILFAGHRLSCVPPHFFSLSLTA